MDTDLFLDKPLDFSQEKLAGTLTKMPDNTDLWPQQIMQEAYKQIPYLSQFSADVVLDKMDEERGYAFGSIALRPKSDMSSSEIDELGLPSAHVPVLIKEHMLYPLDVFLVGRNYLPLTESRLKEALFRPEMFDAARDRPPDRSLVNELYPPLRSSEGGFGGSGIKMGSAPVPLLPQLHGTVRLDHKERFVKSAMGDASLLGAYANADEGVRAAFESALNLEPTDIVKSAEAAWGAIKPNVVQLTKQANGKVLVKYANTDMYAPQEEEVPLQTAQEMIGDADLTGLLESDGSLTVSPEAAVKETMELEEIRNIDQFGLWSVQDTMGAQLTGWAFPGLLTCDLTVLPLTLFSNGSQYALQDHIAGKMVGKSTDIPRGVPRGYGCLYYLDHGNAKAFVPMTITTTYRGPSGNLQYVAQTDLGDHMMFSFEDGLKKPAKVSDMEWAIPSDFCWLPLKSKVDLVSEPALFTKVATKNWVNTAEIVGDKDVFSFRGPGVAKLGSAQTKFIGRREAEFIGVSLGMHPTFVKEALDRAAKGELVKVKGLRDITPAGEKIAAARQQVTQAFKDLDYPIRNFFLLKEAAVLDDAMTADKILGLGFLNAENVATFVDMIPQLEDASSKLAEMLIASRLGLKDVPEAAIERMLVALEDVIKGLKSLRQKELSFA